MGYANLQSEGIFANILFVSNVAEINTVYVVNSLTVANTNNQVQIISLYRDPALTSPQQFRGFGTSPTSLNYQVESSSTNHIFFNDTTELMRLQGSTGNMGVNLPNPQHRLHVGGDARFEGNLFVAGNLTFINTAVSNATQIYIENLGTGPALYVDQRGGQPVVLFQKDGVNLLNIDANSRLTFSGTSLFIQDLEAYSNVKIDGNLVVNSVAMFFNDVEVMSNVVVEGSLNVWGPEVLGNSLTVSGVSLFAQDISTQSNVLVQGNLVVQGQTYINNTVTIVRDVKAQSNIAVAGNVIVSKELNVNGNAILNAAYIQRINLAKSLNQYGAMKFIQLKQSEEILSI